MTRHSGKHRGTDSTLQALQLAWGFLFVWGFFKVIFLSFYFNAISSLQFTEASFDCVKMEVVQLSIFLGNSCWFS